MSMMLQSNCCSILIYNKGLPGHEKIKKIKSLSQIPNFESYMSGVKQNTIIPSQLEDLMQQNIRNSSIEHNQPSLKKVIDSTSTHDKSSDRQLLFQNEPREFFQLSYLYHSPHYNEDPSYTELVKLISNYNDETIELQKQQSLVKQGNSFNRVKLTCMRLIYKELLSIAVMEKWEVKKGDLAGKLKNWYYSLGEHHSFLEGVSFKKRKQGETDRQSEEHVRSTFVSKVFDEIGDYRRRQIDFSSSQKTGKLMLSKIRRFKREAKDVNLPLIDLSIYKREDARIRQMRQKEQQQHYLTTIRKNKMITRENSLQKLSNLCHLWSNNKINEQIDKTALNSVNQYNLPPAIKSGSVFQFKAPKIKLRQLRVKQNPNNRLSLTNINGINLINYKIQ